MSGLSGGGGGGDWGGGEGVGQGGRVHFAETQTSLIHARYHQITLQSALL